MLACPVGCSKYATGVPGSLNHLLGVYGVLSFSIGLLGTWSASNNAAMFAEVGLYSLLLVQHEGPSLAEKESVLRQTNAAGYSSKSFCADIRFLACRLCRGPSGHLSMLLTSKTPSILHPASFLSSHVPGSTLDHLHLSRIH